MNQIKVSIIMPIYNVEKYLKKCFDSVIDSTLKDIEIIAVDDGAKDSSGRIIDEYALKDSRIIPIHKENGGYGSAVNTGLNIAKGEFITILETDDWVAQDMYEQLYNMAKKYNCDCMKGNFYYCPKENENNPHLIPRSLPLEKPFILKEHPEILLLAPSIWSAIYKREFIEENNIRCIEQTTPYEDLPFACEVYSKAKSIVLTDKCFYYYRCEPTQGSSTMRKDRKLFKVIKQINNTLELCNTIGSLGYIKEYLFKHIYNSMHLFVGNAAESLKEELFSNFGAFFTSKYAQGLKLSKFNSYEKEQVKALKNQDYTQFKLVLKYQKHRRAFFLPFSAILQWISEGFSTVFYYSRLLMHTRKRSN